MTSFPTGQLFFREFPTLTEAHVLASEVAAFAAHSSSDETELRLIDVSGTAGGAWTCGWLPSSPATNAISEWLTKTLACDVVAIDETVMNAFLSLGPKPSETTRFIGIIESVSIAEVFRSAAMFSSKSGVTLLEIRIKRSGPSTGAHAFFALDSEDMTEKETKTATKAAASKNEENLVRNNPSFGSRLQMTVLPLIGDYRRFFL